MTERTTNWTAGPASGPEPAPESKIQHPTPKGEAIEVIALPSGETWNIVTRPKFGRVQSYLRSITANEDDSASQLAGTILAFTVAWSYKDPDGKPLPITEENMAELDSFDVFEMIGKATDMLAPFLDSLVRTQPGTSTLPSGEKSK